MKQIHLPFILATIIFLFFQLQVFDTQLSFRDEGFLTYNALRILQGEIPYRDFFLTTTPGTFYIQGLLMKLFGNYLIVSRAFYIVIILGILFLISKIFTLKKGIDYLLLTFFGLLFISPAYAFYNIEGLFLFLFSLLIVKTIKKPHTRTFILLGVITGILFLIKQSYGLANAAAIILSLYLLIPKKLWMKKILIYLGSFGIVLVLYGCYLLFNHALHQFMYYVFSFSREVKGHRAPFIITSLAIIPLYYFAVQLIKKISLKQKFSIVLIFISIAGILYFVIAPDRVGRLLTIVRDPLIYYYFALFFIPLTCISIFWKTKSLYGKDIMIISFFCLFLFLASAASGRDYTTVLIVSPFFLPLCILLLQKFVIKRLTLIISIFLLLYTFPFHITTAENLITNHTNNSTIPVIPEAKGIKIAREKADELGAITTYIKNNTQPDDKILCFPYCPLLFVLTERNSASYFSFFYPETFRVSDQERVIKDIIKNKPKMIVLQRVGTIEPEANFEDKRLTVLKNYFFSHYQKSKETKNFLFYVPK